MATASPKVGLACAALAMTLMGCIEERIDPACALDCFDGPSRSVEIRRDGEGIVHVYGANDADVFFGSGYAQASDRLFEMDLTRRQALGRRAEILGEEAAEEDALIRSLGMRQLGRDNAALLREEHPETYQLVVAWVAGVNARIDDVLRGAAPLPYGFAELDYVPEVWTPDEAMAVGKLVLFGNANQIEYEILGTVLREYFPEVAENFPVLAPLVDTFILPPLERPLSGTAKKSDHHTKRQLPPDARARFAAFSKRMANLRPGASNSWAVAGEHTDNGRTLIAGDPHQALRSPSLMWAHHMNSVDAEGTLDVAGFSFVGSPTVQLGHNHHVAWTATTNYPDVMDLFRVPVSGDVATVGGTPMTLEVTDEVVVVRGGSDMHVRVERIPGMGVLLPDEVAPVDLTEGDDRILLCWPGFAPTHDAHSFFSFDAATDLVDFEAAVDSMELGNFNFIAATADDILYRSAPVVPARPWASDAKPPYAMIDGTDPSVRWTGEMLSPEMMPRSTGGGRGWLASANNDPLGFTADGSIDGDAFYFGVFFDAGTRASRIETELERLATRGGVTRADMELLQLDTLSLPAELLIPELEAVWETVDTDAALVDFRGRADLAALVQRLSTWDRRMLRDSEAAVAFHAFMNFATKRCVADDLSIAFDAIADSNTLFVVKMAIMAITERFEGATNFMQEGKGPILLGALADTAEFLATQLPVGARWRDYHVTHLRSLYGEVLDGGRHPTDGADGTVSVSGGKFFDGDSPLKQHESDSGAIFRLVTGFDEDGVPAATMSFTPGNSGEPTSPFFSDRLDDWIEGRPRSYAFRTADVMTRSEVVTVLEPR